MQALIDQLAQTFFQKSSLQDCHPSAIANLSSQYPFCSVVHLLETWRLKQENPEQFSASFAKTALYVNNPFWLNYLLTQQETEGATSSLPLTNKEVSEPAVEAGAESLQPAVHSPVSEAETIETPPPANTAAHNRETESLQPAPDADEEAALYPEEHPDSEESQDMAGEIRIPSLKLEPLPDENAPLSFEPYHTVDYFASQGIKLSTEEKPADKFGLQLKSFTEWLKTLKKTPAAAPAAEADNRQEQKVVTLAEHSLEKKDILTEAMADVWLKQGNRQKAIEIYNKLSLLNPAKSAYFASLIEKLNEK